MAKLEFLFEEFGQSVWLDYIDRSLLVNGGLQALVEAGLRGVTSNPTIFHQAIDGSHDYDDAIRDLIQVDHRIDDETLFEWLAVQDVQRAADILRPVYDRTDGGDGYVSLEVPPQVAFSTDETIAAAQRLWRSVDRPNLMIKVPGTEPGLEAIEKLTAAGINVNVTLLFSVERYQAVADAWLRGIAQHPDPKRVASVASFFVSRIDTAVDAALAALDRPEARALQGRIAIANARTAYQHFKNLVASDTFNVQRQRGARAQRLLWASTSTKNEDYPELLYVEQLIGPETVNTLPMNTLDTFLAQGEMLATLDDADDAGRSELQALEAVGVDLEQIARQLEQEGVEKFAKSYDQLLAALKQKRFEVAKQYAAS